MTSEHDLLKLHSVTRIIIDLFQLCFHLFLLVDDRVLTKGQESEFIYLNRQLLLFKAAHFLFLIYNYTQIKV